MARSKGSANFAGSLEVLAGAPIDARLVVDTKTDLITAATYPYHYVGMPVYVKDEAKLYLLTGADPTVDANWKEVGSGGGGGGGTSGVVITKTLLASGWDANNRQTLTFTDYDADMGGVIGVPTNATAAQKAAYAESIINVYSQSGNQFTFEAETVPSIDLPVTLYAGGGSGGSGSGGHTIKNDAGTALTQRDNLQFKNATVTDNGTDTTVVETEKIQYAIMPAASASNVGQIVQYIGETTTVAPIYVKGLFYEVVEDTSTTPSTYSWVETTVQEHPDVDLTNVFASGMPVASVSGDRRFNYQTDEHEVGTWIDGRTVYQKTIVLTNPSNVWGVISLASYLDNTCEAVISKSMWIKTSINAILTEYYHTGSDAFSGVIIKDPTGSLGIGTGWVALIYAPSHSISKLYLTVQYIKTT